MTLGDEVQKRYPRLIRTMRRAGLLTESEAIGALVDYKFFGIRDGFGSEAVAHLGGPLAAIRSGVHSRHRFG
ncbi:MAG: hypothetical protein U5R46_08550 [Gammaproteobacteria bacterium]|nr:hypothetical protein [Gammaproteobacteria bacterium]